MVKRSGIFNCGSKKGQALIELAVFSVFFLLILGVLLSYGLKYNYQQKAQMTAFRHAMKIASDSENRGSGSAMVVEDRSIPDPSDLFGVGTVAPVMAAATVQRDYHMHEQAVDADSLQGAVTDVLTSSDTKTGQKEYMRRIYKTNGFRIEYNVPSDKNTTDKYSQIFGSILAQGAGGGWVSISDESASKGCTSSSDVTDSDGNVTTVCSSETFTAIRVIDSCSGELPDLDACTTQARELVDTTFCTAKCNLALIPGSDMNCSSVCSAVTNPPNQNDGTYNSSRGGAWYAADPYCVDSSSGAHVACNSSSSTNRYVFPHLNELFGFAAVSHSGSMGIQGSMTQDAVRDQSIRKTETAAAIQTQESAVWTDTLNRTLVHQDNLDANGFEKVPSSNPSDFVHVQQDPVQTQVSGSSSATATTSK